LALVWCALPDHKPKQSLIGYPPESDAALEINSKRFNNARCAKTSLQASAAVQYPASIGDRTTNRKVNPHIHTDPPALDTPTSN
jgi:hypothetical protein